MLERHNRESVFIGKTHDENQQAHFAGGIVEPAAEDWGTFDDGDITPDISTGSWWKTANTGATTITDFENPKSDLHKITILFTDTNTTIQNNADIVLQDGIDFTGAVDDIMVLLYDGTNWVEQSPGPVSSTIDHGGLQGLGDDDHLQYLLTLSGANHGDIPFVNPSGRLDVLAAELGSGFLVLNSRGPGFNPVWLDVQALIQAITGGENVEIVKIFNIVFSAIAGSTAVDSSGAPASTGEVLSVILAAFAGTTAVDSSGAPASESGAFSPALPAFAFSTQVIP